MMYGYQVNILIEDMRRVKMNEVEKLNELLGMQKEFDVAVMEKHKIEEPKLSQVRLAYIAEIGEVVQAIKAEWQYWKLSQKPTNWHDVLMELADAMHFALTLRYRNGYVRFHKDEIENMKFYVERYKDESIVRQFQHSLTFINEDSIFNVLELGMLMGFTFDEMCEAYKEKHKINYERLESDY